MKNISNTNLASGKSIAQVQDLLMQAFALHQKGQWAQAERIYENILAIQPSHFDAMYLLGMLASQTNRHQHAIGWFGKAIEARPDHPAFHFYRGVSLQALKQWEAAIADYEQAIALKPDFAEAWLNRGIALKELKQLHAAIASYDKALAINPGYAEACFNRGIALKDLKQFAAAVASYEQAIAIKRDYAEAWCSRGTVLQQLGQLDAAVASHDRAIAIKPDYAQAYANRGNALQKLQQLDAAIASYEQAIAINPRYAEAYYNRGTALKQRMQVDAAIASYEQAIAIKPDFADAHLNKALLKLLAGDYAEGWQSYEWRWKSEHKASLRHLTQPMWLGNAPLRGKTILLHCEQGFGDTLQFCRYVPLVSAMGAQVIVEAPAPLVNLLKTLDDATCIVSSIDDAPPYDYQCPLMSLPLAFKTTLQTVPASLPYLKADALKAAQWKSRLQETNRLQGLRVGLAWSGGFRPNQPEHWNAMNERRNIPLSRFADLNIPGVAFYSLQKREDGPDQLMQLCSSGWAGPHISDFTEELHDFSDTAALIANLDLVISVDTAVAHLAGALGKPVWLLNRHDTCWRWLLEREDSPWYPTMRIFRQSQPGDWESVLATVRDELAELQSHAIIGAASSLP